MVTVLRALLLLCLCASCAAAAAELNIEEPQRLQEIERGGFTFGDLVLGPSRSGADNAALYQEPAYRSIVDSLATDLRQLQRADPQLGLTIKAQHRMFDAAWLRSSSARFELAGVVNRMDRAVFNPGSCGEIRFVYRLAYRKAEASSSIYSRLPMTVNVVFLLPGQADRCSELARQWIAGIDLKALGDGVLSAQHLKSVEINLQAVRWPSTARPDMAGHAEYFLRVFRPEAGLYVPAALENTPDVEKVLATPTLKQRLIAWLAQPANFQAVDDGIARLPDEYLAHKATSVALHGTHRLANMPFTRILSEAELADLPYAGTRTIRSPHGLLVRLNDLSCTGCHQGRTVAGFHFLGIDRPETDAVNAIAVGASPHFVDDQPRRLAYVMALATGAPGIDARPPSVRSEQDRGGFGAHCGLGDPSFAAWTCAPGLHCEAVTADDQVSRTGICLPDTPIAGSACQGGRIVQDRDPHRDRLVRRPDADCGAAAICESASVGFPGGMCSHGCTDLRPGEACGSIAVLQGFNACLAARKPFSACLHDNVRPAALKACSAAEPCRDDFICARTAAGQGACIPPYFLFQLRVDGHPSP
ncbi:MAG TPA: hypothetical protein VIY51_17940 [Xanthobacteraceae bacterium]